MDRPFGEALPALRTGVPGPRSRELAGRLRAVESRNVTAVGDSGPIFWSEASGANVRDVDGNVYIDLTAGFGVSAAGHGNPSVADAVDAQFRRLPHAMGDVHPADVKVQLLERLAGIAPGDLSVSVLSADGSDAVEAALKTAVLATGRTGVVAFRGGYHGLGYGALAVTWDDRFRRPFARQLFTGVHFAPFPAAPAWSAGRTDSEAGDPEGAAGSVDTAMEAVRSAIREAEGSEHPVGAVIVEPILGRGGIIVPPDTFLPALRRLCDDEGVLLILDEIYTGLGRTGRWFACQHWSVEPDLLVLGKSLAGGLPLSALVGRRTVMDAWPPSTGEAIHTSTFLGNPVTCAAALAQLDAIESGGLVDRAAELGARLTESLRSLVLRYASARSVRGRGLMQALAVETPDGAHRLASDALQRGVVVLPEGAALAFTPPLTISEAQLDHAVGLIESLLAGETGP